MQNDFCPLEGHIAKLGRNISVAQQVAQALPEVLSTARQAGVLVIFVRNVYSTKQNHYLSDVWLEQAARKRGGGGT
jgi:nicotinamidase-related amidase